MNATASTEHKSLHPPTKFQIKLICINIENNYENRQTPWNGFRQAMLEA
jgi:hypothetical protein